MSAANGNGTAPDPPARPKAAAWRAPGHRRCRTPGCLVCREHLNSLLVGLVADAMLRVRLAGVPAPRFWDAVTFALAAAACRAAAGFTPLDAVPEPPDPAHLQRLADATGRALRALARPRRDEAAP